MILEKQQSVRPLSILLKSMALAGCIGLASCGGSDGTTSTDGGAASVTVTGKAESPSGQIAQFEDNKSYLVASVETIFPGAIAGITGLQPVTGATVELIKIDDDGNQVGDVLATTSTTITGDYSLALPDGVSLAGNLIVRITGNSGASMSAMVVDQAVDINPISQFVLDKFVDDDNLILADLAINEVVALSGRVEEFDLTAAPGSNISTMLAQLEAEVGQFVDNEIAVIESTPDDGTTLATVTGIWHSVEFGIGMHDHESGIAGTFAMDMISEEFNFTDTSGVDHNMAISIGPLLLDTFTNFTVDSSGTASLFHQIELTGDAGETFPANIDADGNISVSFPFEEELQTVDIGGAGDLEGDGPDFGWRFPPGSEIFNPVMGGNMYVTVFNDVAVRYLTTDTNGDGVKDAIDPAQKEGDEVAFELGLFIKAGSGMGVGSLSGDYGAVFLNINVDANLGNPTGKYDSSVGVVTFDGNGSVNVGELDVKLVTRTLATPPNVTLALDATPEPADPGLSYTVSATGQVTLVPGVDALEGYASSDGSVIAIVDNETEGDPVSNVNNEMLVFVKLGETMTNALDGASYRLYMLLLNASASGETEILSLGNGLASFNADASSVTMTGVIRGVMRASDIAAVEAVAADALNEVFAVDSVAANGEVSISFTDRTDGVFTTTLKGFVSADSNLLVLRNYGAQDDGTSYDMGMIIGVRQ
jgi:hypothetical protein